MTQNTEEGIERQIAAVECARAAISWFGTAPRDHALREVMQAMSRTARVLHGELPARRPSEFIKLLENPLGTWLTGDEIPLDEVPLVEEGMPTQYCEDLVAEGGADPEAELVQRLVGEEARRTFARRVDGAEGYVRFRRFLIEHPYATESELTLGLMDSGIAQGDLYEQIPASHQDVKRSVFYPCPRCHWPMRIHRNLSVCDAKVCRADGARFHMENGQLVPLGPLSAPDPVAAMGRVRLKRGAWRYTLLPGLAELALAEALMALPGVEIILWPHLDQYDLYIKVADRHWRVDVKDWADPLRLARNLMLHRPPSRQWIVVPDERYWQLRLLREHCDRQVFAFATMSELLQIIREEAKHG